MRQQSPFSKDTAYGCLLLRYINHQQPSIWKDTVATAKLFEQSLSLTVPELLIPKD